MSGDKPDEEPEEPKEQLVFLEELVEENATIAGDVVQLEEHLWGIHGEIAVDGDVLMAEFETREEAQFVLDELPARTRRTDPFE